MLRELAGRTDDETRHALPVSSFGRPFDDRDEERQGLAGARLGLGQHVHAFKQKEPTQKGDARIDDIVQQS